MYKVCKDGGPSGTLTISEHDCEYKARDAALVESIHGRFVWIMHNGYQLADYYNGHNTFNS